MALTFNGSTNTIAGVAVGGLPDGIVDTDMIAADAVTDAKQALTGAAKAWINFDGTGTVSIRDSYNVSSLTDHATGVYEVSFTSAMANNDYVVTASAIEDYSSATSRSPRIAGPTRADHGTGSVHIASWATNASEYDVEECHVHVIGD